MTTVVRVPVRRVLPCVRHHRILASCDQCIAWLLRDLHKAAS